MARTTLTKTEAKKNGYGSTLVALTMAAADTTNQNDFVAEGDDLIVIHNTGGSPYTVTINSVADPFGRTQDVNAVSVPAGEYRIFGPLKTLGWMQSTGKIHLEASNAAVKFGIIKL